MRARLLHLEHAVISRLSAAMYARSKYTTMSKTVLTGAPIAFPVFFNVLHNLYRH